jgi:predicted MFS family arabinose efflux permease
MAAPISYERGHEPSTTVAQPAALSSAPRWGAVFALSPCVATLIASEFMPVSLLTPIAADLHVTEGHAGQAIAVSGIFAVLTSLGIMSATRGIDRRLVLLSLTALMIVSGVMVALAPNAGVFMAGRALVGVVIGGFWSMSAATVMRLVPERDVPRALGVLNGGNALAFTVAALPLGMLAVALFFLGQFARFTYLRPFLETVTRVDVSMLSLLLLIMGGAGLLGTYAIGVVLRTRLYSVLVAVPSMMAAIALALPRFGESHASVGVLLAAWGLLGTAAPVAWWTWLSKVLPDDAEAGGGLMVAVIQLAIAIGATLGGALFDASGYQLTFTVAAAVLGASALLAAVGRRLGP